MSSSNPGATKIYLDSDYSVYKTPDISPSDLIFSLENSVNYDFDLYALSLLEVSAPNIEPVIIAGVNDKFLFNENLNTINVFTATLTEGFYQGSTFASELQTRMNASGASNTYTCSYNPSTFKITITTTIPNTFRILGASSGSTCLPEMGFSSGTTTFSTAKVGDYVVNLCGSRYLDIRVNHQTGSVVSGVNQRGNIMCRMSFDVPKGSIQNYQAQVPVEHLVKRSALSRIEITMYNDRGLKVKLPTNHKYTFMLSLRAVS